MKRKVFLIALMVFSLACILAIGTFAAAYDKNRTSIEYTDVNGTTHTVPIVKSDKTASEVAKILGNNENMQALFEDNDAYAILADSNGKLTAFPSWYIVEPKDTNPQYVAISEIEYGFVNTLVEGSTFSKGAIRYIEFPHGMTEVRSNSVFGGSTGMYEINVTEIHIPKTVTSIGGAAFENKTNKSQLKYVYIEAGNNISKIDGGTFSGCNNLEYVQFENLTEITSLDGVSGCNFKGELDLSKCSKLTDIGDSAFNNCEGLTKITLPNSIEKIGNNFSWNSKNAYLASPYLPANLKTIGTQFFYNAKSFNNLLIFPEGFVSIGNEAFQDMVVKGGAAGNEFNLVFLGKMSSVVYLNGNGHQKHAERVTVYFAKNSLSDYNKNGFYIKPSGSSVTDIPNAINAVFCSDNGTVELSYIISTSGTEYTENMANDAEYGFDFANHTHFGTSVRVENTCGKDGSETISCIVCDQAIVTTLEATGNHNHVEGVCTVCGHSLCPGGADHDMKLTVIYKDGFVNAGVVVNKCQNEGCDHEIKESDLEAIFTFKGYSAKIGGDRITVGYLVNKKALATYEEITDTSLNYGIVACLATADTNLPITLSDGNLTVSEHTIMIKVDSTYTAFDFILNGFTSEQYGVALVMCAYVFDGESVNYITDTQNEYAYSVTFNSEAE